MNYVDIVRRAEVTLAQATELFDSAKRVHAEAVRQGWQTSGHELPQHSNSSDSCTAQMLEMRKLAGLDPETQPPVGELNEQEARQRNLAGMSVTPTVVAIRPCTFFPVVAEKAHRRIDVLDLALLDATQAPDGKANVDLEGYPAVMTAAAIWSAIEEEKAELRRIAQP
jgi:hypothetical protein